MSNVGQVSGRHLRVQAVVPGILDSLTEHCNHGRRNAEPALPLKRTGAGQRPDPVHGDASSLFVLLHTMLLAFDVQCDVFGCIEGFLSEFKH